MGDKESQAHGGAADLPIPICVDEGVGLGNSICTGFI